MGFLNQDVGEPSFRVQEEVIFKVKTIEEAKRSSKKKALEVYRVPRTCVIDWCRQEAEIREEFDKRLKSAKKAYEIYHCFKSLKQYH